MTTMALIFPESEDAFAINPDHIVALLTSPNGKNTTIHLISGLKLAVPGTVESVLKNISLYGEKYPI